MTVPMEKLTAFRAMIGEVPVNDDPKYVLAKSRDYYWYSPILKDAPRGTHVDWARLGIVAFILASAIGANVIYGSKPIVPYEAVSPGAEVAPTLDMTPSGSATQPAGANDNAPQPTATAVNN